MKRRDSRSIVQDTGKRKHIAERRYGRTAMPNQVDRHESATSESRDGEDRGELRTGQPARSTQMPAARHQRQQAE
jgi:hypothetical protein